MSTVSMSARLPAPVDEVWKRIGDFDALCDWHPAVDKSEVDGKGEGSVRKLTLVRGGTIVERLERLDEDGYQYVYSITDSPVPVSNYLATLRVRDEGDGKSSLVEWSSEFEPAGVPENDAIKVVQGIYSAGFENLKKMFGG